MKSISAERLTAETVLVVDVPALDYKTWYDTMENRILVPKSINSYSKKTKMFRSKWGCIFEQFKNQFAQHWGMNDRGFDNGHIKLEKLRQDRGAISEFLLT